MDTHSDSSESHYVLHSVLPMRMLVEFERVITIWRRHHPLQKFRLRELIKVPVYRLFEFCVSCWVDANYVARGRRMYRQIEEQVVHAVPSYPTKGSVRIFTNVFNESLRRGFRRGFQWCLSGLVCMPRLRGPRVSFFRARFEVRFVRRDTMWSFVCRT